MELRIISPSEDGFIKEIKFNHEELKQELTQRLEKYQGLVYSDDSIKLAKADKAALNSFRKALEDRRKEIKKQCLEPYESFEIKIKEIIDLVDKPLNEIDKQVKAFEVNQEADKLAVIKGVFIESVGDLKDILTFEKIYNYKWMNVSYKLSLISKEIIAFIEKVKNDLAVIETLNSKHELQMKDKYLEKLVLTEALATKTQLEAQEVKLEEYKKAQEAKAEEARKAKEEKDASDQMRRNSVPNPVPRSPIPPAEMYISKEELPPVKSVPETIPEVTPAPLEEIQFKCWVNAEQKKALIDCIRSNNIKCGKV